jgi:ADP-ribosylglycohydrolase
MKVGAAALRALSMATVAAAAAEPSAAAAAAAAASASLSRAARVRGAVLGGLVGDSLALGGHYEYDARVIADRIGSYTELSAPTVNYGVGWGRANYHPGKKAGDMTDAGDVAMMLLEYLSTLPAEARFDFDAFAAHWRDEIEVRGYGSCNFQSVGREATECPPGTRPGYLNGATRRTLDALRGAPGARGAARRALAADVNCLFGATHVAPLLALREYAADEAALVRDAVATVYISHRNRDPVAAADFLARASFRLLGGAPLRAALEGAAAATGDAFISARLAEALAKAAEAADAASPLAAQGRFTDDAAITSLARLWDVGKNEPIKVGKASPTEGALPAALYFSLRYEGSLEQALVANANCGGDSGARAMVIGLLLGAVHGDAAVPPRWAAAHAAHPRARELLAALEARGAGGGGAGGAASEL